MNAGNLYKNSGSPSKKPVNGTRFIKTVKNNKVA